MGKAVELREVEIAALRPYDRNAKQHSKEQVEKISRSIQELGFVSPCLIDKELNVIAGHGRIMAAKAIGMTAVPCVFIEGLTEAQRRAYIIADNRLTELNLTLEQKSQEITQSNSEFQDKFERKQQLAIDIAKYQENIKSLSDSIQKLYTDFFDNYQKSLREFNDHEITTPVEDLKSELDAVKKKIEGLGFINYMAEDEFNEAKKSYDFYSKNLEDLTKAKNDLEEVIAEIRLRSEQMFMETYGQIAVNFQEMFTTLFGGGKAELVLTDEENVLESGIDIKAQPPGKKMLQLGLLSGGERSMTAVALLFATYMVKPSPFCILDEIDAALDAHNVGAFMRVLDKFNQKSQFIIITHNKGTVMGSDCLLGVTQQESGVSKMIGYRIEDIEDLAKEHDTLKG